MQPLRFSLFASLLMLAAIGCRTSPTSSSQLAPANAVADLTDVKPALAPTLRYLRTEPMERDEAPEEEGAPQGYWDVLELHNGTESTFERVAHMSCDWIWTRCYGVVDVLVPGAGWTDPQPSVYCGTGCGYQQIPPGESVTIRTSSWLRPTRVTVSVRNVGGRDWRVPPWQDHSEFVELPFVEYDSARAAPDATPPALFVGREAAEDK